MGTSPTLFAFAEKKEEFIPESFFCGLLEPRRKLNFFDLDCLFVSVPSQREAKHQPIYQVRFRSVLQRK